MRKTLYILCAAIVIAGATVSVHPLAAQHTPDKSNKEDTGQDQEQEPDRKLGLVTLPIIAYTPESTLMMGLNFMLVWNHSDAGEDDMPDLLNAFIIYTLMNQIICGMNTVNYIPHIMMIKGGLYFQKFPNRFYGIGPNTSTDQRENYTAKDLKLRLSGLFNPAPNVYLGPRYEYGLFDVSNTNPQTALGSGRVSGSRGTHYSGFGFEIVFDSKDNYFYPFRGAEIQLIIMGFHRYTGSAKNFYRVEFDYRQYFRIYGRHVFAFQCFMQLTGGDVPFQIMPALGGQYNMRGYFQGRYRDKNYLTTQFEYRYPLFWRLSGVLFLGAGLVTPTLQDINFRYLRISGGAGLRLSLHLERMINLRFDVAVNDVRFGSDNYALYFSVMEAF